MRLTTDRCRLTGALVAAVFAAAGCDVGRQPGIAPAAGRGGAEASTTVGPAPAVVPSPRPVADGLLKSLGDGTLAPEQLTAAFRQKIAPPKTEDDKKAGYSDAAARKWLGRFEGARFTFFGEPAPFGDAVAFRGRAESGGAKEAFSLRLVKDGRGYRIDWLQRTDRMGTEFTVPPDADLAAAQDTVRNFVEALIGADPKPAQLLMAPAWRRAVAQPPPGSADDFDEGYLTGLLKSWRDRNTLSYTLPKQALTPTRDGATFTAVLDAGNGSTTPYAMTLSKDPATGHWVVESFAKQ